MPYVERDNGNIVGAFGRPQSFASEWVADDDVELVAFKNPPVKPISDQVKSRLAADPVLAALVRKLAKDSATTEQAMIDAIAAEAKDVRP